MIVHQKFNNPITSLECNDDNDDDNEEDDDESEFNGTPAATLSSV